MSAGSNDRSEFGLGWKVLVAGFVGTMCGASPLPFNVLGLMFKPLKDEFGWDKAQVSIGVTIYGVVAALLAPVFGMLSDKYGVRRVAIWSVVAFALAFAAMALTPASLAGYYALWLLVGLVGIGSTPVTWSRAIGMWFVRNRGLALGLMLLGTSAAGMIVPKIAVTAAAAWGWRSMFPVLALMPLMLALPLAIAWFREPRPEETPKALVTQDGTLSGLTFGEAIRTRQFWLLWASILLVAFAYGGAHTHMIPIVMDHGLTMVQGAGVMGIVALGLLAGRVTIGFLLDRIWGPLVTFPVFCLPAIGCYLLLGTADLGGMVNLAAFLLGFAAGAESDVIAFFAARYFGMAHFGRIYGMLYMPFGLASAVSPVVYGLVRDRTGSYDPMLATAAAVFIVGGALLLLLGRYPETFAKAHD